jgi:TetR/AcrR family transcriptional regulator
VVPSQIGSRITAGRILDAAAAVFADEGFGGARVDEIARRAGVNKAMLYYHVGDKADLYAAVLSRNFDRVRTTMIAALSVAAPADERLRRVVSAIVSMLPAVPHHPRIMLREVAAGAANLPDSVVLQMAGLMQMMQALLSEGAAAGAFRPVDPLLTHLMILGTVTFMTATEPVLARIAALAPGAAPAAPPTDLAAYLSDVLLNGIASEPDRGDDR